MDFIKRMVMPDKIRVDTKICRATEPRSRLSDGQQNLVILLSGGKSTCPGLTDKWNFEPCTNMRKRNQPTHAFIFQIYVIMLHCSKLSLGNLYFSCPKLFNTFSHILTSFFSAQMHSFSHYTFSTCKNYAY